MKRTLAGLLALGAVLPAAAQERLGNEEKRLSQAIKLHYVWGKEGQPPQLEASLQRFKGVDGVTFFPGENSVNIMYSGEPSALRSIEGAGGGIPVYILSHATAMFTLKSDKDGETKPDAKGYLAAVDEIQGVHKSIARGAGSLEVSLNLEAVTPEDVVKLGEKFAMKVACTSHEHVDVNLKGDKLAEAQLALNGVKGLVTIKLDTQVGVARCVAVKKQATDDAIKKALAKVGMEVNDIVRR